MKLMLDKKVQLAELIVICVLIVAIICYVRFALPLVSKSIDAHSLTRSELSLEISDADKAKDDPDAMQVKIDEAQQSIDRYLNHTSVNAYGAADDLIASASKYGMKVASVSPGEMSEAAVKNANSSTLMKMDLTVVAGGSFDAGIRYIESLESADAGAYTVRAYTYKQGDGLDISYGQWIIELVLYYY